MTTTGFFLSSSSPNHMIRGILTILTGLFMFFMPESSKQIVMVMIGVMFLISGLITLILSNIRKDRGMKGLWSFQGITNLAFGFAFVIAPNAMFNIFMFLVGCILLLLGIIQLINTIGIFSISRWSWIFLILSLLTLGGGILLLFSPFESVKAIFSFVGFLFVIYGTSEISLASKAKNKSIYHKEGNIKDIPYEEV